MRWGVGAGDGGGAEIGSGSFHDLGEKEYLFTVTFGDVMVCDSSTRNG